MKLDKHQPKNFSDFMTQTISQILTDKGDNKTWHPVARAITGCPKNTKSALENCVQNMLEHPVIRGLVALLCTTGSTT